MQSFLNNFLAGDPGTVITVGIIFFVVLFAAAFFLFGYTIKLQAENGFTFAFLVLLSLMLPLALRQTLVRQNTATQATPAVIISNIQFVEEKGKNLLRLNTSVPSLVYVEYESQGDTILLVPTYLMTKRIDHTFELQYIPAGVEEIIVVINGQRSEQRITLP